MPGSLQPKMYILHMHKIYHTCRYMGVCMECANTCSTIACRTATSIHSPHLRRDKLLSKENRHDCTPKPSFRSKNDFWYLLGFNINKISNNTCVNLFFCVLNLLSFHILFNPLVLLFPCFFPSDNKTKA